ncbi:rab9 effector protein with kelch motifs [Pelomyxa schiedti]|nr:rab9 effector protein with kelch motifs [Pelomyxa schiedti]
MSMAAAAASASSSASSSSASSASSSASSSSGLGSGGGGVSSVTGPNSLMMMSASSSLAASPMPPLPPPLIIPGGAGGGSGSSMSMGMGMGCSGSMMLSNAPVSVSQSGGGLSSVVNSVSASASSSASSGISTLGTAALGVPRIKESNELFAFEFDVNGESNGRWSKPKVKGDLPGYRYCHTADYYSGSVVLFGGFDGSNRHNEVYVLDLATLTWRQVRTSGQEPEHLSHHTTSIFGNQLIVFGGLNDAGKIRNELYMLDLCTMTWARPELTGSPPGPRLSSSSAVYGHKFWVFGGYDGKSRMNDVHCLDFSTMRWSRPVISGQPPCPRYSHSMTKDRNFLLVFGGDDGSMYQLDDLYILDLDALRWIMPTRPEGTTWPDPRKNHTSVIHKGYMYIFGGSGKLMQTPTISDTFSLNLRTIPDLRVLSFDEATDAIQRDLRTLALMHSATPATGLYHTTHHHDDSHRVIGTRTTPLSQQWVVPSTVQPSATPSMSTSPTSSEPLTLVSGCNYSLPEVKQRVDSVVNILRTQFNQLHKQMDQFTQERQQFEELVEKERLHQKEMESLAATCIGSSQRIITLNVGGTRYDTSINTLTKDKNSMLAVMFGGRYEVTVSPDGSVFLDRDGTHFKYILNYLRDGHVSLTRDKLLLKQLLQEAEFYQLEGLKTHIKEKLQKTRQTTPSPIEPQIP